MLSNLRTLLAPVTTLVTVNYRLGRLHKAESSSEEAYHFPIPIHDVATVFSYLTCPTSPFNEGQDVKPKICLLGSHIGGALATMLALTEPNEIHALAAIEPVVDWVMLDEVVERLKSAKTPSSGVQKKRQKQKSTIRYGPDNQSVKAVAEQYLKLRAKLFSTPSAYFDPFASPTLFLRAPGRDTPLEGIGAGGLVREFDLDVEDDGYVDQDYFEPFDANGSPSGSGQQDYRSFPASRAVSAVSPPSHSEGGNETETSLESGVPPPASPTEAIHPPRRRKVLRRWPPVGRPESVTLPYVKIFVRAQSPSRLDETHSTDPGMSQGHSALMRTQGAELVELMRRACFFGREKGYAEERVQLHEQGGAEVEGSSPSEAQSEEADSSMASSRTAPCMQESAVRWIGEMFERE